MGKCPEWLYSDPLAAERRNAYQPAWHDPKPRYVDIPRCGRCGAFKRVSSIRYSEEDGHIAVIFWHECEESES